MRSLRSLLDVRPANLCSSHGYKVWKNYGPKRRYPVNKATEDDLPVHQYVSVNTRPDSRVYTWGYAELGALGHRGLLRPTKGKKPYKYMHRPMRLGFAELHKVTDIACGYGFTVLAVNGRDDKVFGCGINTDSQIGLQEARAGHPLERVIAPAPIHLPLDQPEQVKVVKVACGRSHTVVLTDTGHAYTLGNNAYGQCGRRVIENEQYSGSDTVHRLELPEPVRSVTCGQDHTLFITESGRLLSCGWGADGQTGRGHFDSDWQPQPVLGDLEGEKVVKVACSADCVLAVTESGDVFGWGNSEYGQLSAATSEAQLSVPRRLPLSVGRVTDVASAGTMCALLNDGNVYVWGYGLLGKGPELEVSTEPSMIPPPLLGRNDFSPDSVPVSVDSGLYHLAVRTSTGDLFTWGHNQQGTLGLGHTDDRLFPLRVSIPARVNKVACGVDHMVALCREFF